MQRHMPCCRLVVGKGLRQSSSTESSHVTGRRALVTEIDRAGKQRCVVVHGCITWHRAPLHHSYRQLCATLTPSLRTTPTKPSLQHPGLSCKVYNMLWHTHDITQIRLRCRGVTRETRRGVGRF